MSDHILISMINAILNSDSELLDELLNEDKNIWDHLTTFIHDEIFKESIRGQTLLHIAADASENKCVTTILSHVSQEERVQLCNMVEEGQFGRIPLHTVLDGGCRCKNCTTKNIECVKSLIEGGSNINLRDREGDTPLVYAVIYMMAECASVLLEHGADQNLGKNEVAVFLSAKKLTKIVKVQDRISKDISKPKPKPIVLYEYIAQKIPSAMTALLDEGIVVNKDDGAILCLDFKIFLPDQDIEEEDGTRVYIPGKETHILNSMANAHSEGRKKLLTHPMTLAFIHFKWSLVQRFILCIQFLYVVMTILYTWFVFQAFSQFSNDDDDDENENSTDSSIISSNSIVKKYKLKLKENEEDKNLNEILAGFVCVWWLFMILNEFYEMSLGFRKYLKVRINYGWWVLIICVGISVPPGFGLEPQLWQLPIASFAVFLAWGLTLVQTSRFPSLGIYIEMLGKVIFDFLIFVITFGALLIGFALAFHVLFPQDQMFSHVGTSFVKIILIMIGETDYETIFEDIVEPDIEVLPLEYTIPAHIMFVGFIFIITIVLMNLLLGLAVSDIQELKNVAIVRRVKTQIEQIELFETLVTKLLPQRISDWANKQFSILNILQEYDTESSTSIEINPTDPEDDTLPNDLKEQFIPYVLETSCLKPETLMDQNINSEPSIERRNERRGGKRLKGLEDKMIQIQDTLRIIQETLNKIQS